MSEPPEAPRNKQLRGGDPPTRGSFVEEVTSPKEATGP
jgi:hypothetical protein